MRLRNNPKSGDPSPLKQYFSVLTPRIHCCREWAIHMWNISHQISPYWRLYWNRQECGTVHHKGKSYSLGPEKVVLIAPETDFIGEYNIQADLKPVYELIGNPRGQAGSDRGKGMDHLFIHFNFGPLIDIVKNEVVEIAVTAEQRDLVSSIGKAVADDPEYPGLELELKILSLLSLAVSRTLRTVETLPITDNRISNVLKLIEDDLSVSHRNENLAKTANLSLSRFEKLFTEKLGQSPGRYINCRRIEEACILLDHKEDSIELIAESLGFCDRHHFSKIFKKYRGVSPAAYRKAGILGI